MATRRSTIVLMRHVVRGGGGLTGGYAVDAANDGPADAAAHSTEKRSRPGVSGKTAAYSSSGGAPRRRAATGLRYVPAQLTALAMSRASFQNPQITHGEVCTVHDRTELDRPGAGEPSRELVHRELRVHPAAAAAADDIATS